MALLQKAYLGATPLWRETKWHEDFRPELLNIASNVTVTANTAAHTKGSWSQLIASTPSNASILRIVVSGVTTINTDTSTLLDLATGASGSEAAFASNIAIGGNQTNNLDIPLQIPSGTRIAARIQSVVTGGKTATVAASLINDGNYTIAPTSVDVINAGDTATSKGTAFSGASGTWVEAVASSTRAYRAIVMTLAVQTNDTSTNVIASNALNPFEIGVGAAGSEVSAGIFRFSTTVNENVQTQFPTSSYAVIGRNIPSGSRIAVKHPISSNPDRYGFTLIGIP
jgi:hypothetical protein